MLMDFGLGNDLYIGDKSVDVFLILEAYNQTTSAQTR